MACRPAEDQWLASSVIQNIADTTLSTTQAPGSLDNEISTLLQEDAKAWREEDISNLRAHLDEEEFVVFTAFSNPVRTTWRIVFSDADEFEAWLGKRLS